MITLSHLHKYYNKGKQNEIHVINDISLTLPEKGIVALFGRSGCGKTTLLNVIGGLDTYHSGKVSEDGKEIFSDLDVYRNRDIGYIFQNYNLLKEESCFENVASALRLCGMTDQAEISTRVETALSFVDMDKYARRTPDTLSGGQQQRVAIARAIVKNPRIILADEPTGNLDEVNTVMVMDLLREIARDCLVILVTHEAELVDYYCDTVIELADGKVMNIRENRVTDGYKARDKNTIYLGELEKTTVTGEVSTLSYYGKKPETPIALRLVNYGGKTYLSVDTPGIQLLDKDSEMKLFDGTFERKESDAPKESHVDMSRLPRVSGKRFGRLFTAKSAIVSGYRSNFGKRKKGKKLLQGCLALFAAVIVFMTAIFGTAIGELEKIKTAYNPNTMYLRVDEAVGKVLLDGANLRDNGIIGSYIRRGYMYGDEYLFLNTGFFETFENSPYGGDFSTHGVYLPASLAKKSTLYSGRFPEKAGEVLLSSTSADLLLENATLGSIKDYSDLLGLTSPNGFLSTSLTVVGVCDGDSAAFYLEDMAFAEALLQNREMKVVPASLTDKTVKPGTVGYMSKYPTSNGAYRPDGTVKIAGADYAVAFCESLGNYHEYLEGKKIEKLSMDAYVAKKMKEAYPTLSDEDPAYHERYNEVYDREMTGWYLYYYSELDEFSRRMFFFEPDYALWLYLEKGMGAPYFQTLDYNLYLVKLFEKENGRLPTRSEMERFNPTYDKEQYYQYENEFYRESRTYRDYAFVLNDDDYRRLASQYGESEPAIDPNWENGRDDINYYDVYSAVIYVSDAEKAEAFLSRYLPEVEEGELPPLITPDTMFDEMFFEARLVIFTGFGAMAVILAVMSICMYFIMRSALMNRIREIGIYRAIGVSKKNLISRFTVESAVLTLLTVFVGYLLASGFVFLCLSASKLVSTIFFYPVWLAGAVLLVLFVISMVCGVIPIRSLLRKSPSAILSKYDI